MKVSFARVGVLLAAVAGLMATMIPTASANTYKTVTFTGSADLSECSGLGYPGAPPDMMLPNATVNTKPGPKNTPEANINPGGNHCSFALASNVCVKSSVGKKLQVTNCTVTALGTVQGFCGLSHGKGFMQISSPPVKGTTSGNFAFNAVGGVLIVTGGTMFTNFVGDVVAVPPIATMTPGSCTSRSARTFILIGEITIKDCTRGVITITGMGIACNDI